MIEQILKILRKNNSPRNWVEVFETVKKSGNLTKKIGKVNNEPVYRFFDTYSDDLTLNSSSISIAVQPTKSFIPFHIHDYVEIMIPLVENCTVVMEHSEVLVKQDNLIFMGNRTIHKVKPISENGVVVNIALRGSAFSLNELDYFCLLYTSPSPRD